MAKATGLIGQKLYKLVAKKRTSIGDSCRSRPTNKHQRRRWKAYRGQKFWGTREGWCGRVG